MDVDRRRYRDAYKRRLPDDEVSRGWILDFPFLNRRQFRNGRYERKATAEISTANLCNSESNSIARTLEQLSY